MAAARRQAALDVVSPSGARSRVAIPASPFSLGRQAGNQLVLRDNRISRTQARIVAEGDGWTIEDLESRHGTFVNGQRTSRRPLSNGDVIEFGFADSYRLTFVVADGTLSRILDQMPGAANLAKLRAVVEVARALQHAMSTEDVLSAVVDAALAATSAERGFLFLRRAGQLDIAVARERNGTPLAPDELKVPSSVLNRALEHRRELLSMNFDPLEEQGLRPDTSIASLELRSVVCVPLVKVGGARAEETSAISAETHTIGLLYLDSRAGQADLSHGNRELLQTLALEASTILENARLLEEERAKQRLEKELDIAREIQAGLLPSELPASGWFRAAASSTPSHQVGGDYFDVRALPSGAWSTVVADVSGKGVSSALLASLLQGAFLLASDDPAEIGRTFATINRFLIDRAKGEKYATVFYSTLSPEGRLQWTNAGHCAPLIVGANGDLRSLETSGFPVGMLEIAEYPVESTNLQRGDKVVIFSDGITEAQDSSGQFFGAARLKRLLKEHAASGGAELHDRVIAAVEEHAGGVLMPDDVTLVVLEYLPAS